MSLKGSLTMLLSIVVPCYNEEQNIIKFIQEVKSIDISYKYEIIFVNDGSRDRTLEILKEVSVSEESVKFISFSRNFGKESAMLAGLEFAKGDAIVLVDADLQHPVQLIPEMIRKFEEGYDQVIAKRTRNGDSFFRSQISKAYYALINYFIDVKLTNGIGDFRLLSRRALDSLLLLKEYNRFSKGLFSWIGFKEYVIEYDNVVREEGQSKWSFTSLVNYGIDGLLSFNNKPLRASLFTGFVITGVAVLYLLGILVQIFLFGIDEPGYFTIIAAILLLGGVQLISLGIIGEYIGRIYYEVKARPSYIVSEKSHE